MAYLSENEVVGHRLRLIANEPEHYGYRKAAGGDDPVPTFAQALGASLRKVNTLQIDADRITQTAVEQPEKVDVHDVMIAAGKARLSMRFTKEVVDRLVRGFRELTTGR